MNGQQLGVLSWSTDETKFPSIKLDSRLSYELLQKNRAHDMADRETIRLGHLVNMIGGGQAASSSHVFDDDSRVAGDVFAKVSSQGSGIKVVTTAGCSAYYDTDNFTFVKRFLGGAWCAQV